MKFEDVVHHKLDEKLQLMDAFKKNQDILIGFYPDFK